MTLLVAMNTTSPQYSHLGGDNSTSGWLSMVGDDTGGSNHSEVNYSCGVELTDEDWEIINQYR